MMALHDKLDEIIYEAGLGIEPAAYGVDFTASDADVQLISRINEIVAENWEDDESPAPHYYWDDQANSLLAG